jgi:hypothetical protein
MIGQIVLLTRSYFEDLAAPVLLNVLEDPFT